MTIMSEYKKMIDDDIERLKKIDFKHLSPELIETFRQETILLLTIRKKILGMKYFYDAKYHHQYYVKNREKIMNQQKKKLICPICQGKYQPASKTKHNQTQKHQFALNLRRELE